MNDISLFSILPGKPVITGTLSGPLTGLTDDSRLVTPGSCYIAKRGTHVDGHTMITSALEAGAAAIVAETPCSEEARRFKVLWVQTADTREADGLLMAAWNGFPSQNFVTIGVTGTNGKTTTSYLAHAILRHTWVKAGLVGTILYDNGRTRCQARNTTPGAAQLQAMLREMAENGCRAAAMEISSHALDQRRTAGLHLHVGIFTNLTQDHLDYHGDMEHYFAAKRRLFEDMVTQGDLKCAVVVNIDDPWGRRLANEFAGKLKIVTYGTDAAADFRAIPGTMTIRGSDYELVHKGKSYLVRLPLIGLFNIYNSLAALAGTVVAGVGLRDAVASLAHAPQVPGRLELISSGTGIQAFIDYAHTPDALANVCGTLKQLAPKRLITVFGCGGNRDHGKRPLMGKAASEGSDICIATSDNPRGEGPNTILDDVMPGIPEGKRRRVTDRREAILEALSAARHGDVVLIAGKGHEDYQEIEGVRHPFSDADIVRDFFEARERDIQASKQAEKQEKNDKKGNRVDGSARFGRKRS